MNLLQRSKIENGVEKLSGIYQRRSWNVLRSYNKID